MMIKASEFNWVNGLSNRTRNAVLTNFKSKAELTKAHQKGSLLEPLSGRPAKYRNLGVKACLELKAWLNQGKEVQDKSIRI